MKPYFANIEGYRTVVDPEASTWWETWEHFYLDPIYPLTLVTKEGNWQPNRSFLTNRASIPRVPPFIRCLVPKDRFLMAFLHDSGYIEGGLWFCGSFRVMKRKEIDDLFRVGMMADPEKPWKITVDMVWSNVRLYGWAAWNSHRKRHKCRIDRNDAGGILKMA